MKKEDEFEKLPNELVVDILSRLSNDAKFLTQTLGLVNKRIASLISTNITSVSTTIPKPNSINYSNYISKDYSSPVSVKYSICTAGGSSASSWNTAELWDSRRWEIPPCDFFACKAREKLQQFRGLEKAQIEYPNFDDHTSAGIIFCPLKWKVEYSSAGKNGVIKSCALLGVDTLLAKPHCLRDNGIYLDRRLDWLAYCFKYGLRFHPMAVQMARDHQYLRDISVTTKCNQRVWIHAGEEEIIKMRRRQEDENDDQTCCMHMKVKVWHVPVMDLQIGLLISGASFVVATSSDDDDYDDEIEDAARRFWGNNGAPEDSTTQIIDMAEAGMATLVDKKCNMEINTIWHWTAGNI